MKGTATAMQDQLNYIKPGRYKKPVDADSRRDEFDLKTLDRYKKDSFYWYKKVIASQGEDLD